jgi:hypothetical protein
VLPTVIPRDVSLAAASHGKPSLMILSIGGLAYLAVTLKELPMALSDNSLGRSLSDVFRQDRSQGANLAATWIDLNDQGAVALIPR